MSLDNESIAKMLEDYEKNSKAIKKHIFKLCWYMRGGVNVDEMFQLGYQEREIIGEIIKENIDITNETKLPFF